MVGVTHVNSNLIDVNFTITLSEAYGDQEHHRPTATGIVVLKPGNYTITFTINSDSGFGGNFTAKFYGADTTFFDVSDTANGTQTLDISITEEAEYTLYLYLDTFVNRTSTASLSVTSKS